MLLKDKRVFIAEDNMQNRIIFQVMLQKHGATVHFERRGDLTIIQLKRMEQVDIILLDLMLADGISGFDMFDKIRALPEYQAVPIVAVSAIDPGAGIAKTKEKGFSGFIAKPIDDVLFPRQIAAAIAGEQVWHAGERAFSK